MISGEGRKGCVAQIRPERDIYIPNKEQGSSQEMLRI
jgi:hypothetical protein